jgi:hypothetical protein
VRLLESVLIRVDTWSEYASVAPSSPDDEAPCHYGVMPDGAASMLAEVWPETLGGSGSPTMSRSHASCAGCALADLALASPGVGMLPLHQPHL